MNISNRKSVRDKDAARQILDNSLTAAIAAAQILGYADTWDRLLLVKRDVIRLHSREERRGASAGDQNALEPTPDGDLFAIHVH